MKKQMLGMLLIAASTVLFSCQKQIDQQNLQDTPTSKGTTVKRLNSIPSCNGCVTQPVIQTSNLEKRIGAPTNPLTTVATISVWNTATHLFVKAEGVGGRTFDAFKISYPYSTNLSNGNLITNYTQEAGDGISVASSTWSIALPTGWTKCNLIDLGVRLEGISGGGGVLESAKITYTLYEFCPACEEAFSYVDNGNGTYTFSYTSKEAVTDALVEFTFAQSDRVTVTGLGGWTNNGQTYQSRQSFAACETKTWTVGLTPKCDGAVKNPNLWTDFKVNGVSKKNDGTPNIIGNCN